MTEGIEKKYRALLEAASFAARAHQGQFRKDRQTPYVSHVFRVCLIVRDIFGFQDAPMLMAALLHDTLEDTTTDFDDLAEIFPGEIPQWVSYLSKDKRLQEEEREREYHERLRKAPWQVKACKLADMFDNLMDAGNLPRERRSHTLARVEGYWNILNQEASPEIQRPLELVARLLEETKKQAEKP